MGKRKARGYRGGKRRKKAPPQNPPQDPPQEVDPPPPPEVPEVPEDEEAPAVHALLVDHVLDSVFQYMIASNPSGFRDDVRRRTSFTIGRDIRNARLVCKIWNERATRVFRAERSPIRFGSYDFSPTRSPDFRFKSFLETVKKSPIIPTERYSMMGSILDEENRPLFKEFMNICGPEAVELTLILRDFSYLYSTQQQISKVKWNLPRLKTLEIRCLQFNRLLLPKSLKNSDCKHEYDGNTYLLEVMLAAAPNLQEFEFALSDCHVDVGRPIMRELCKQIPKPVKSIRLNVFPLSNQHFGILAEKGMNLDQCDIRCDSSVGCEDVRNLLESQSQTLTHLVLSGGGGGHSPIISKEFPQLNKLRYLELQLMGVSIAPITFRKKFPQLEVLNLEGIRSEVGFKILLAPKEQVTLSVQELVLTDKFPRAGLEKLASRCFPNTKKVSITVSSDTAEALQQVFIHFPEIEELRIFTEEGQLLGGSLLSGVPKHEFRRVFLDMDQAPETINLADHQTKPSIHNLKKLKKLAFDGTCDITFMDFSAYYVFMRLPALEELDFNGANVKLSPPHLNQLKSKLKVLKL